ncbi:hypothetical protein MRB53_037980 [Persea americana]|nr:hypothetical protein MRB53_037980 [Persea americana]
MSTSYFNERILSPTHQAQSSLLSPDAASPSEGPRTNALQTRITNVLSASYADLDIRDALTILDDRDVNNTAETRRHLRLDVQEELIQCNGEIVSDFSKVAAQLKRVGTAIDSLKMSCTAMRRHIAASQRETAPMLDEAKSILSDKAQVESKQQVLDAFTAHFVVDETELALLTSSAEPVNDEFFKSLTRLKKIHEDSQILLGSENQRLGLEILETSSRNLTAAFQKLYRWVQREFKSLDLENPQISAAIRRALRVLAERPSLFQNCLDFFAEARENVLSNNFYAALTGAPVDKDHPVMGKAIELSAHDPLRYVGDMLAWAHSATVSEREALESLFISEGDEIVKSIQAGIESEPWSQDGEAQPFDGRTALSDLVNRDLTGVCRQLKQRVEQVIQSHEDAILAYRISNLVSFYCNIFVTLVGEDATLLEILRPVSETAMRSFGSIVRDHITQLQVDHYVSEDDLSPPEFLTEALDTLQALMKSYDTSASTADRFQRIEDRTSDLDPRIYEHIEQLIRVMHRWFLHEAGLNELVDDYTTVDDFAVLYQDNSTLVQAAQQLDTFLPSATDDARAFLAQLDSKTIVKKIVEDAAEKFCEDLKSLNLYLSKLMRRELVLPMVMRMLVHCSEKPCHELVMRFVYCLARHGQMKDVSTTGCFLFLPFVCCEAFRRPSMNRCDLFLDCSVDHSMSSKRILLHELPFHRLNHNSNTIHADTDLEEIDEQDECYRCCAFTGAVVQVYSPHTAVDAAPGGLGDWLADIVSGEPARDTESKSTREQNVDQANNGTSVRPVFMLQHHPSQALLQENSLSLGASHHKRWPIKKVSVKGQDGAGMGRVVWLNAPVPLSEIINRVSLGLAIQKHFRLQFRKAKKSRTSQYKASQSVLVQLLLLLRRGSVLSLCFHSNTERGFLHGVMKPKLEEAIKGEWTEARNDEDLKQKQDLREALADEEIVVHVSEVDRDPYGIMIRNVE